MSDDNPESGKPQSIPYERVPNLISIYANNAYFESSAWDLKIVFGQLDQPSGGTTVIKQNLAVTLPWTVAKLALYWLRVQVEAMELQSGKIVIRQDLLPPEPPPLTPEQEAIPGAKEIRELVLKIRSEFIAGL